MVALFAFVAAAAATHLPAPTREPVSITVADGRILASDVARGTPEDEAVVATLPAGARQIVLSEEKRLALLHNRFPGGQYSLLHRGSVRVVRDAVAKPAPAQGTCFAARSDIAAGEAIEREQLTEVACSHTAPGRWLVHDALSRTLFAQRAIPAGTYLGHIRPGSSDTVAPGSELVFRTREGPVTIEREVVAVQSARVGRRVFARTRDGEVLTSTLAGDDGK